jgi:hypothetical protein
MKDLKSAADAILHNVVGAAGGAPGVVAMATDRKGTIYEGAAGKRELGKLDDLLRAGYVQTITGRVRHGSKQNYAYTRRGSSSGSRRVYLRV